MGVRNRQTYRQKDPIFTDFQKNLQELGIGMMLQMVTVRLSILSFHFFRGRAIFCLQSISAIIVSHGSVKPISVVNLGPLDHLESFFKLSAAIISFQIEGFKTIAVLHPTFAFFFSRRNQKLQTAPLWLLQNSFIISNIREELLYYASGGGIQAMHLLTASFCIFNENVACTKDNFSSFA